MPAQAASLYDSSESRLLEQVRRGSRGAGRGAVAALVLVVEPGRHHRIDPERVATTLELTPAEARVTVWLAEDKSVRDAAEATG